MAERDPHATDETPPVEPFQPDPYLRQGRLGPWAKWVVGVVVLFIVVFVLFALNASGPEQQAGNSPQPTAASSTSAPSATTGSGSK